MKIAARKPERRGYQTFDELRPFLVAPQMTAESVNGRWPGFDRLARQEHVGFFRPFAPLAPVTLWAGGHQVLPGMAATLAAWDNVIDGQIPRFAATILAGIVIAAQHFPLGQRHARPRPFDHVSQFNNRGRFKLGRAAADDATAV